MKTPVAKQLSSGNWFCRVRVDGKDIGITRPTEKECIAEAMAVKAGIKQANKIENITLTKAIDKYIEDRAGILSPSTVRGYRCDQRNHLQDLMHMPIAKIDTQAVQKAVNKDATKVSAKTIKNALGLVTGVLGYYNIQIGKLTMPERQKVEKQIYTRDELCKLLDAIRGTDVEVPVLLAAWLGLRRSEILGLRWDAVDYEKGTVAVTEAMVMDENHKLVSKGTKTASSRRTISCPVYILDVLRRTEHKGEHIVMMHPTTISRKFNELCNQVGIPAVGLHALRHQNASTMLLLNVPDKYVMERGGWSNTQTPKTIYQHTMDEGRTAADDAINGYFNEIVGAKKPGPKKYKLAKGGLPRAKKG